MHAKAQSPSLIEGKTISLLTSIPSCVTCLRKGLRMKDIHQQNKEISKTNPTLPDRKFDDVGSESNETIRITADLIVGADGAHSTVRNQLQRFTKYVYCRDLYSFLR
jgi:2-polyprenyl-6-methoxyphenol hydroxylase-like FAD-dependent oxidoreductase